MAPEAGNLLGQQLRAHPGRPGPGGGQLRRPGCSRDRLPTPAAPAVGASFGSRWRLALAVLAFALGATSQAQAQNACRVSVDAAVAFGTYSVLDDSHTDSTGLFSWRCPGNFPRPVRITISRGVSHDGVSRRLAQGGEFLRYDLYRDSARTLVWGDGTYGSWYSETYPGSGWIPVTIYARIPRHQDVAVGAYSDTVTIVINF